MVADIFDYLRDAPNDFLWNRPNLTNEYYEKTITIFGHTPTLFYSEKYKGKIIKTKSWINIDVGAASGL